MNKVLNAKYECQRCGSVISCLEGFVPDGCSCTEGTLTKTKLKVISIETKQEEAKK